LPYPNLANVPAAPASGPANEQALIAARARNTTPGVSPPSPEALAGLELPAGPPPVPPVPGLNLPSVPSSAPLPPAPPAPPKPVKPPNGPPIAMAFPVNSAILPFSQATALKAVAIARGDAQIRVGGFGDGVSLPLALARAQRLADGLTANGVPPGAIHLIAAEAGSGGFVQLVY
jgi:hypothetical protein